MLKLDSCARDCRDDLILKRSGRDAIQYLKFQRYLLAYMGIITILSIGVILPCNFHGAALSELFNQPNYVYYLISFHDVMSFTGGSASEFGHTTISNVSSGYEIASLFCVT